MGAQQHRRKLTSRFKDEAVRLVNESGRPIAEVARDIRVNEGTLGNWIHPWRSEHTGEESPLGISERAELAQLRRDNQTLRMERELLKSRSLLRDRADPVSRYRLILSEKAHFEVTMMCRLLEVGRSAYYVSRRLGRAPGICPGLCVRPLWSPGSRNRTRTSRAPTRRRGSWPTCARRARSSRSRRSRSPCGSTGCAAARRG